MFDLYRQIRPPWVVVIIFKMTLKDKVQVCPDIKRFTLFKEGLFYKCFNLDALIFAKRVKNNKVILKYVKSFAADVLSLGYRAIETGKGNLHWHLLLKSSVQVATEKMNKGEPLTFQQIKLSR